MAAAFSLDLLQRAVAAVVEEGLSTYAAARRFAIGVSTVGARVRQWRRTGELRPGRQGRPKGSKLDPHAAFIELWRKVGDEGLRMAAYRGG